MLSDDEDYVPASHELWDLGVIASYYLRDDQLPIHDFLFKTKDPFFEAARRYGKTTSILIYVLEQLIRNPNWVCRWCEPNKNQAREIVLPELEKIQKLAPKHRRFKWQTTDSVAIHNNGSRIYLRGINEDKGDSARGPFSNIIVADELGTWRDTEYVVNEALRPQLLTTRGQFIFTSTPPRDLGHPYYEMKDKALRENRFFQRIIYDNTSLTATEIADMCEAVGGPNSPAWRREFLCEPVSNPDDLVVPEYNEVLHVVKDDYPRPRYFDPYVGIDLGLSDFNAFIFGYHDFLNQELVIEDELVVNGKNSKQLAEAALAKENELWPGQPIYKRVSDNEMQQLYDMASLYKYSTLPTAKDDKLSALSSLRVRFQTGKIKIKERCKSLRYQLKVGIWNTSKTSFQRTQNLGHLDAIDALIYLNRNLNEKHNPWPLGENVHVATHFIPQEMRKPVSHDAMEVQKLFIGRFGK